VFDIDTLLKKIVIPCAKLICLYEIAIPSKAAQLTQ
jgi:hypothetical protein